MNKCTSERISSIKGLLIILVVFCHFLETFLLYNCDSNVFLIDALKSLYTVVYSFHMPLFVFVSGFLSRDILKRRDKAFEDLLIPFFMGQVIYGTIEYILKGNLLLIKNIFWPQFAMWYLLALFVWRVMMPYFTQMKHLLLFAVLLNIVSICFVGIGSAMAGQRILGFFVYYALGYKCRDMDWSKICFLKIKKAYAISVLAVETIAFFCLISNRIIDYQFLFGIFIRAKNITGFVNPLVGVVWYVFAMLLAVLNSVLVIMLCKPSAILHHIGRNTLPLYLSHGVVYYILGCVIGKLPIFVGFFVICCAAAITVYAFSHDIYRNIFFRVLNGLKKWGVSAN